MMNLLLQYLSTLIWGPIVAGFIILYLYLTGINKYWELRRIEYVEPQLLFGNFYTVLANKENVRTKLKSLYNRMRGSLAGFYLFTEPVLMVRDPDFIKQILVIDFDCFTDRGLYTNEPYEPITGNLLAARGDRWRAMRHKLAPTLTSCKLKQMFDSLKQLSTRLQDHVTQRIEIDPIVDVRDLMVRFTSDTIARIAFGTEVDSINNQDEEFLKIAKLIARPTRFGLVRNMLAVLVPNFVKCFYIRTMDAGIVRFLRKTTRQALELRESGKVVNHDFMQLMAQLRNGCELSDEDTGEWNFKTVDENKKQLTVDEIMAQLFVFLASGFENTSSTMAFALFELAKSKAIQHKFQTEIDTALKLSNGEITYDCIDNMKYLDQLIDETLRMYPPVPYITRSAVKPYKIPGTDIMIDENQKICIPVEAMHHDADYYDEPDVFNPDRFIPDEIAKRTRESYIPFGDGPRNCIGMHLGRFQIKVGLVAICLKFNVALAADRSPKIKFLNEGNMEVEDGLKLKLSSRILYSLSDI